LSAVLVGPSTTATSTELINENTTETGTSTRTKDTFVQCTVETRESYSQGNTISGLLLKSTGTQTECSFLNSCEANTQTDEVQCVVECNDDSDDELESSKETVYPSESIETVSPMKDKLKLLAESSSSEVEERGSGSQSECEEEITRPQDNRVFLVFKDNLVKLLKWCSKCGAAVTQISESTQGTLLNVTTNCIKGHNLTWQSQPTLGRMAAGNMLLSSAILLSGSTYTKMASFAEILNLQFLGEKSFYKIQDAYLFPVINDFWIREQNMLLEEMGEKEIWLSGDGRCDSPGHNAKYGTYTVIDQGTEKVVDMHIVQVSEVANSNAMERVGFRRCMETFRRNGKTVKVVATDRHIGINADIRREHPDVEHQYDVWHLAKSIKSKLTEKAKKKNCDDLFQWIKSISNHLWWCAETSDGNKALLKEMWISVIFHAAGIHS